MLVSGRKLGLLGAAGLILVAVLMVGCGSSPSATKSETKPVSASVPETVGTSLETRVSVDVGSAATPIVVGKVAIAESVEAFVVPSTLPLYEKRLENPLSEESMERLAGELELEHVFLSSQGFSNDEYVVEFPGGSEATCFTIWQKEAGKEYVTLIEQGKGDEVPPFPADDELIKMADEYLQRLGLEGSLEQGSVFVQEAIGTRGEGATEVTYELSKGVGYQARIDGLPLLGPGAKIYAAFGPRGEIVRFAHWVMPFARGPDVRLRELDVALGDITEGEGLPPATITQEAAREIAVTGVSLAYYAEPLPMKEKYYKPVFVFTVLGKDGKSGDWIVPAFEEQTI